jgi:hypothetical protein
MDNIVESSAVEDFDNPPSKKIKCSKPDFSDPITSPASLQSNEIDDDQQLEEDKQIKVNSDPILHLHLQASRNYLQLLNLEDKQASEIDDDQQLEETDQNRYI